MKNGADNPNDIYREDEVDFTYEVQVYYDGELLTYQDGSPVEFKVYIGVKGDTNFDNLADANDASNDLVYYAQISTGGTPENTILTNRTTDFVNVYPDLELDELAAFLGDVDKDVYDDDNWKTRKDGRLIDATDASSILVYYAEVSTGNDNKYNAWNIAVTGREEKIKDFPVDKSK